LHDPLKIGADSLFDVNGQQHRDTAASDNPHDAAAVNAAVLIPAYNASATIGETLGALQSNLELHRLQAVIVLDDSSRDATVDVARSVWHSQVPLEIWSNAENAGERTIINSGLAHLSADIEWAFILHADDVVKRNWISLYLNEMIGCPEHVASICSSYDVWYPDSGRINPGEEYPERPNDLVSGTRQAVLDTLNRGCWWHISGSAIRMRAFRQIGGFNPDMPQAGDWEWLLRCLAKGFSVLYLPRSTMFYRQHARSVSSNSFRRAQDLRETLQILAAYRDQGYLTLVDHRRKIRGVIYHLCRRTLVRAIRRDLMGVCQHASLLARTLAKYLLGRI
jgi:glycosyltransferase involved in cell wall biosynthesis